MQPDPKVHIIKGIVKNLPILNCTFEEKTIW